MRTILIAGALCLALTACGTSTTGAPPAQTEATASAATMVSAATEAATAAPEPTEAATTAPAATAAATEQSDMAATATAEETATASTASGAATSESGATTQGQGQVVVEFHRSGGIAGYDETTSIYSDGTVIKKGMRGQSDQTQMLPGGAEAVDQLMNVLDGTNIYSIAPGNTNVPCCDHIAYTLTILKDGKYYQYATYDGNDNEPTALRDAIDTVRDMAADAK